MACITQKQVREKLERLGGSSKAVAASLGRRKCKGVRNSPYRCPVAKYLKREFKANAVCVESVAFLEFNTGRGFVDAVNVKVPRAVLAFINDFDTNVYPKLVK